MNNKEYKGTGSHVKRTWEEICKGGGEAPSLDEIKSYLGESEKKRQLSRGEVRERIYGYFANCVDEYEDSDTGRTYYKWRRNPTKSGLAMALGVTAETMSHYVSGRVAGRSYTESTQSVVSCNDFDLIQAAVSIIQEYYESNLGKNRNNAGSIFWLLNVGEERWTNSQTIRTVADNVDSRPALTQEEIRQIAEQAGDTGVHVLLSQLPDD